MSCNSFVLQCHACTTRRGVSIPRNSDLSPAGRGMESVKLSPIRQRHRGLPAPRVVPADALIAGAASVTSTGLAEMESRECQDSINSARHRGHPAPQAARPPAPDAQNVQSRRTRRETYRPTASNNITVPYTVLFYHLKTRCFGARPKSKASTSPPLTIVKWWWGWGWW